MSQTAPKNPTPGCRRRCRRLRCQSLGSRMKNRKGLNSWEFWSIHLGKSDRLKDSQNVLDTPYLSSILVGIWMNLGCLLLDPNTILRCSLSLHPFCWHLDELRGSGAVLFILLSTWHEWGHYSRISKASWLPKPLVCLWSFLRPKPEPEPDHSLSFPFHLQIPKEGMNCLRFIRFCHRPARLSWVGSSQEWISHRRRLYQPAAIWSTRSPFFVTKKRVWKTGIAAVIASKSHVVTGHLGDI